MNLELADSSKFRKIVLDSTPIIDVRAPVEYAEGSIPGSVNLPIMNNDERAQVGTAYKKQGREAAIELGYRLISGDVKNQRVASWCDYLAESPSAIVTCFRGGLRSKISQEWIRQAGISCARIEGGYKAFRSFLIEDTLRLSDLLNLLVVSGATGVGKTDFLHEISRKQLVIDLEKIANHRGSAFGGFEDPQPTQANFENHLASDLIRIESQSKDKNKFIFVEDESRLIGARAIPNSFFNLMRNSPIIFIEESIEVRTETTFREYVLNSNISKDVLVQNFKKSIQRISKKLGGARTQEILKNILEAEEEFKRSGSMELHKVWIQKILEWYYDPMYFDSINRRGPKVLYRGTRKEVLAQFLL